MTRIETFLAQTAIGAQPGLGIQPHYEAPCVKIDKTQ